MSPLETARRNDWETPPYLFDALDREFHFTIDVCALPENAKCERFYSPEQDGLAQEWTGICWMNPPYGRDIGRWIHKAYESSRQGATVVCLVPNLTETKWWHDYCLRGEIRFIRGRVHFVGGGRPRFGSAIVIFRPPTEAVI